MSCFLIQISNTNSNLSEKNSREMKERDFINWKKKEYYFIPFFEFEKTKDKLCWKSLQWVLPSQIDELKDQALRNRDPVFVSKFALILLAHRTSKERQGNEKFARVLKLANGMELGKSVAAREKVISKWIIGSSISFDGITCASRICNVPQDLFFLRGKSI